MAIGSWARAGSAFNYQDPAALAKKISDKKPMKQLQQKEEKTQKSSVSRPESVLKAESLQLKSPSLRASLVDCLEKASLSQSRRSQAQRNKKKALCSSCNHSFEKRKTISPRILPTEKDAVRPADHGSLKLNPNAIAAAAVAAAN